MRRLRAALIQSGPAYIEICDGYLPETATFQHDHANALIQILNTTRDKPFINKWVEVCRLLSNGLSIVSAMFIRRALSAAGHVGLATELEQILKTYVPEWALRAPTWGIPPHMLRFPMFAFKESPTVIASTIIQTNPKSKPAVPLKSSAFMPISFVSSCV